MKTLLMDMAMDYGEHLVCNPQDKAKGVTFRNIAGQKFEAVVRLKSTSTLCREFDLGSVPPALLFTLKSLLWDSLSKVAQAVDTVPCPELPHAR